MSMRKNLTSLMVAREWVETSDNYIKVHQLLKKRNYKEAQTLLEEYIREQIKNGAEWEGIFDGTDEVSETIKKTIEGQIDIIQTYSKKNRSAYIL